jgi:hypothetical protein
LGTGIKESLYIGFGSPGDDSRRSSMVLPPLVGRRLGEVKAVHCQEIELAKLTAAV